MKKIWNVVLVLSLVFLLTGALCAGISYALGGSLSALYENEAARLALEQISPARIVSEIQALLPF